jgi:alkylation response protein AidB-like acyl-CoA dehydrogenase
MSATAADYLKRLTAAGVTVVRSTAVFGWQDQHGHCEIVFDDVRVPVSNLLGGVRHRAGPAGAKPDLSLHAVTAATNRHSPRP